MESMGITKKSNSGWEKEKSVKDWIINRWDLRLSENDRKRIKKELKNWLIEELIKRINELMTSRQVNEISFENDNT